MPIKIEITGNHATDVAAEIQNLAAIFGGGTEKNEAGVTSGQTASTTSAPSQQTAPASTAAPANTGKTDEGKKALDRKAQDVAVSEMITNGAKDDRFELLTKGRQNEVEAALAKKAETPVKAEADLDDMFADDSDAAPAEVTREMVSELMAKVCKNPDGSAIQDRALKVREILVDHIAEGQEIKVKNLPEEKLAAVYALIEKVGA